MWGGGGGGGGAIRLILYGLGTSCCTRSIIGTHSQGTRVSVWFLHTGHGDVHVRSPEEQLHTFGRGAGGSI